MYRVNKLDFFIYNVSFWLCLIADIQYGVVAGVAVNVLVILFYTARFARWPPATPAPNAPTCFGAGRATSC
jgi:MFS superfamily sulfate permease-like transporter